MKNLGLVHVTVMVPTDRLDEFQQIAAQLRAYHVQQVLKDEAADRD